MRYMTEYDEWDLHEHQKDKKNYYFHYIIAQTITVKLWTKMYSKLQIKQSKSFEHIVYSSN